MEKDNHLARLRWAVAFSIDALSMCPFLSFWIISESRWEKHTNSLLKVMEMPSYKDNNVNGFLEHKCKTDLTRHLIIFRVMSFILLQSRKNWFLLHSTKILIAYFHHLSQGTTLVDLLLEMLTCLLPNSILEIAKRPPVEETANFLQTLLENHGANYLEKLFGKKARDALAPLGGPQKVAIALSGEWPHKKCFWYADRSRKYKSS